MADPASAGGEVVHRLPRDPVHLFQHTTAKGAYNNPMGCGAFSTAMALSVHDPARFGTAEAARALFDKMLKVPFFGGTFENQNSVAARRLGFPAYSYDYGTVADVAAAINHGAPVVFLINPNRLGIGQHDVVLVGYSTTAQGAYLRVFVDNPAVESAIQPAPPGVAYPGNQTFRVAELPQRWTGVFTPIFADAVRAAQWRRTMHRG